MVERADFKESILFCLTVLCSFVSAGRSEALAINASIIFDLFFNWKYLFGSFIRVSALFSDSISKCLPK